MVFGGNLFIFIEAKVKGTPESVGQNRLLETLADTIQLAGKECVVLYFNHNTPTDEVVDVQNGNCYKRYYDYFSFIYDNCIRTLPYLTDNWSK